MIIAEKGNLRKEERDEWREERGREGKEGGRKERREEEEGKREEKKREKGGEKGREGEERSTLAHVLRSQSIMYGEELWQQQCDATGHIVSTVRKQRGGCWYSAQFLFI